MSEYQPIYLCTPCLKTWKLAPRWYVSAGTCDRCRKKVPVTSVGADQLRPFKITRVRESAPRVK